MPRLSLPCPTCGKDLAEVRAFNLAGKRYHSYKCGHTFATDLLASPNSGSLILESCDGTKHSRPYQTEGVEFLLGAGKFSDFGDLRGQSCILADQMRLGKTPQSLIAIRNMVESGTLKGSILILVRSANMGQWTREVKTWVSPLPNAVWIIQGTKNWIPPSFKVYICSMDTFSRRGTCASCSHPFHEEKCSRCDKKGQSCRVCKPAGDAMSDQLLEFGFELVVVDEAHSFKNTDSQRSIALTAFLKTIERSSLVHEIPFACPMCKHTWSKSVEVNVSSTDNKKVVYERSACAKCGASVSVSAALHVKVQRKCQIILLTGTPIKNRASEYFVPLNLVAPELFPSKKAFERQWLDGERINPYRYDDFKKLIAPYVLRREKEDVYKDVPKLNRIFTPITIEDERLKKAYNACLDRMEATATINGQFSYFQSIGELQILRQICGLAKVQWIADYVETFLADSEREKLAIGYHHHSVRDALRNSLDHFGTMKLDGQDSPQTKDRIAHKDFQASDKQILLLGMQAAKEGLELVYISNAIVAEREWSSAEEEQFEFRFYNPDLAYLAAKGFPNKITTVEYIIAQKTIDGFFYDMVEGKRAIFGETISNNWSIDTDQTSFQQLCEQTLGSRL